MPTTADRAWAAVKRSATFVHVTRGLLGFRTARPLPEAWHAGDVVEGRLLLVDCIPAWRHVLRVVHLDDAARELRTNEGGGPMPVWNHHIHVETLSETSCRYTDAVEIQAGFLTPLIWLTAHAFFRYRQRRLRRLLRAGRGSTDVATNVDSTSFDTHSVAESPSKLTTEGDER